MKNNSAGRSYVEDAKIILEEAEESFNKGHNHRAIRKCQESVELALKGILRIVGIEHFKSHRIGKTLQDSVLKEKIDEKTMEKIIEIASRLADEREIAFYGSDTSSAKDMFDEDDASEAIADAHYIMKIIDKLLDEFQ
jgi:HEPN domain-containing protein